MKPIPYGRQHITTSDIQAVIKTLQSDYLTQGPLVSAFEKAFAAYTGAKYAVAVSNGTAALHLSTMALGLQPQQKVITTPITFAASANCIRYCGAEVVFADIDPKTALLDINSVRQLLENAPKGTYSGIIPVDFAGYAIDLEAYRKLADEYSLWIIEDACHAPGGFFKSTDNLIQHCGNGNFAELSIFSFHPVKHIACGEGGMITTNDKDLYEKLLLLRTHGITKKPSQLTENHGNWYYEMQTLGYNYRLPDLNCALGLSQLQRADGGINRRRRIAAKYDKALQNLPIEIIKPSSNVGHAYHLYVIRTKHRKALYDYLRQRKIYAQVHYIPVHTMPYYQGLGWRKGMLPAAENYYDECLSLPMFPTLKAKEQAYIIDQLNTFFDEKNSYYSSSRGQQTHSKKKHSSILG